MNVLEDLKANFGDPKKMPLEELRQASHETLGECFAFRSLWQRASKQPMEIVKEIEQRCAK
jgi:hypothetical protein